ncbi:MAG: hypothetical protein IJU63_00175 [Bacteroidales bacterium]|nr:hypothetical protein [Bacteroidales bacterium]
METVTVKRKLIDLKGPVVEALSLQAHRQGVSLKKYIELVLERDALQHQSELARHATDPRITGLIGIARPALKKVDPADDRAQYLLSK